MTIPKPTYTPPPFVDFVEMKKRVCASIFPEPQQDHRLLNALTEDEGALSEALAEIDAWEPYTSPKTKVDAGTMSVSARVRSSRHPASGWVDHPQKFAVQRTQDEYSVVRRAIAQGEFRTDRAFTPMDGETSQLLVESDWLIFQPAPSHPSLAISTSLKLPSSCEGPLQSALLWHERQMEFYDRLRASLVSGSIAAYWLSPQDGPQRYSNAHFWLDDEQAWRGITTGHAILGTGQSSVRLVFSASELDVAFPSPDVPQEETAKKRGRPGDLGNSIRRALNRIVPDGHSKKDGKIADLRRKVALTLGEDDLDGRTFARHLAQHNEAVGRE